MYEPGSLRSMSTRKSPSMPMLIVEREPGAIARDLESKMLPIARKSFQRRVQSTISLCVGMLLITIILFVLCTLDPSKVAEESGRVSSHGSHKLLITLPHKPWRALHTSSDLIGGSRSRQVRNNHFDYVQSEGVPALEGLGALFRSGSRFMSELVIAHLSDDCTARDLRLFLRGLHRSGLPARADVVLLFPRRPIPEDMAAVIREEEQYFQRLLSKLPKRPFELGSIRKPVASVDDVTVTPETTTSFSVFQDSRLSVFSVSAYLRPPCPENLRGRQESIWGATSNDTAAPVIIRDDGVNYGAIVGFDMQELDPDDALSGFMDKPPSNLRRWVCYQILLGMLRQRYRHVFLTEVRGVFILKDVLAPLKRRDTSLYLFNTGLKWADPEIRANETTVHSLETSLHVEGYSSKSEDDQGGRGVLLEKSVVRAESGKATGRRLAGLESSATRKGIMESVYGNEFWSTLEEEDKARMVISTGVIMGGIKPVRSVASAMATEIVRVSLLRKHRKAFKDEAILSFLVHKSSVLGRKVATHLQIHNSGESSINLFPRPPVSQPADDFFRPNGKRFAVMQGLKDAAVGEDRRRQIMEALRDDICRPLHDSQIYPDCLTVVPVPSS